MKAAIPNARNTGNTAVLDELMKEKRILRRIIKGYDELPYAEDKRLRSDILFAGTEKRLEYAEKKKEKQLQKELQQEKQKASKVPTNRGFAGPAGPNETINPYVKKKE